MFDTPKKLVRGACSTRTVPATAKAVRELTAAVLLTHVGYTLRRRLGKGCVKVSLMAALKVAVPDTSPKAIQ
jgi:hypothetical protein